MLNNRYTIFSRDLRLYGIHYGVAVIRGQVSKIHRCLKGKVNLGDRWPSPVSLLLLSSSLSFFPPPPSSPPPDPWR
jgi:hypothetical protein